MRAIFMMEPVPSFFAAAAIADAQRPGWQFHRTGRVASIARLMPA
jgi:hypothetical protein